MQKHLIFGPVTGIASHLVFVLVVGVNSSKKSLRLRRFKWDPDEIRQECSSRKFESIDANLGK